MSSRHRARSRRLARTRRSPRSPTCWPAEPDEISRAVGFLTGEPRQGRIGVGWATIGRSTSHRRPTPSLTIGEVDRAAVDRRRATRARARPATGTTLLASVFARATDAEADFVRRLFTGELRQGALAGPDDRRGRRRAAGVPAAAVRRAAMLAGDLGVTRAPRAHRRSAAARSRRLRRAAPGAADARRQLPTSVRRARRRRDRRRWSGSSTARASRCTGSATTCASSPATSTTSPTASPRGRRARARLPGRDGRARRRGDRRRRTTTGRSAFQDTMSRFGADGHGPRRRTLARVLLRRACTSTATTCIDEPLSANGATLARTRSRAMRGAVDRHRRRRTKPPRSSPTRSPPATRA